MRVTVGAKGRIVLPVELRRELGIEPGSELMARVQDDHLVLESPQAALTRIQAMFAQIPPEVGMVDELIAERRAEATAEQREVARDMRKSRRS